MNAFRVGLTASAQRDLSDLPSTVRIRILARIRWLSEHIAVIPHQAMHGEEWHGSFRIRVGDYRDIYSLDRATEVLTVLKVGHRRDVYR
jgi:mRNA interferase RelE/StbE